MERRSLVGISAGGLLGVLAYYHTPWLLYPLFVVLAIILGAAFALLRGGYELRRLQTQPKPPDASTYAVLSRLKVYPPPTLKPTLLSANVDSHVQRVLELILKHHVIPTYGIVATDHKSFFSSLVPELWNVLHILLGRVSHVDTIKLISQDTVEAARKHFVNFRGFQLNSPLPPVTVFPDIAQFPYLASPEKERDFLRKTVEVLLCACLPSEYLKCTAVRVLIREYLVCHIVQPTIDRICDPDYINQKLLAYLLRREEVTSVEKYAYTDYEEFVSYLKKCEDVNELAQVRQSIIMDIMQAKAVQHMKEASSTGIRVATLPVAVPAEKAKMLMERDLMRYINQLNTAKNTCERQIRKFGGEDYQQQLTQVGELDRMIPDFPMRIPFDSIMHNEAVFMCFVQYLRPYGYGHLPLFWKAVQDLRDIPSHVLPTRLQSVYSEYLSQGATNPIHADSPAVQEVERTRSHTETCLAAMQDLQSSIYAELQQQFYMSFLHSQQYKECMESETEHESGHLFHHKKGAHPSFPAGSEETTYQKRLRSLHQKVSQKDVALAAMPTSAGVTKRREKLVKDKSELEEEIKRVEHYIEHTEEWFGTVGQWSVEVSSFDLIEQDGNDRNPFFVLVVHRPESNQVEHLRLKPFDPTQSLFQGSTRLRTISEGSSDSDGVIAMHDAEEVDSMPKNAGWVIGRRLSEFQELHKKVTEFWPDLSFPPVPRKLILFQRKESELKYWKRFCRAIESYMNTILQDPKMQESEDVFNFLSPASAEMRQSSTTREDKSAKLASFPAFFESKTEASILDHFSSLITEVFELQERSRILRRQLYDLVQLTYGRSIDRELQDFVLWVLSEPMLVYYLETFRNSMWPNGERAPPPPVRSDEQKQKTREETKQKFVTSAPQTLQTILGQRNCQIGYHKIFTAFQDRHANKQLLYSLLELFVYALVPELEDVHNEDN